jgi:nitroimidazol reductase NimA-like FMN-containing flavoprotein (pyridoxamine 5'-phosphate oxidase superfamily)
MQLLATGGVGRLVYNSRYGPTALPTVYRIDGESIVLGTWDPRGSAKSWLVAN